MPNDVVEALIKNTHWEPCAEALKRNADCNVV